MKMCLLIVMRGLAAHHNAAAKSRGLLLDKVLNFSVLQCCGYAMAGSGVAAAAAAAASG